METKQMRFQVNTVVATQLDDERWSEQ